MVAVARGACGLVAGQKCGARSWVARVDWWGKLSEPFLLGGDEKHPKSILLWNWQGPEIDEVGCNMMQHDATLK